MEKVSHQINAGKSAVSFRGRRHSIVNAKTGMQTEAPFFRLRNLDDGGVTGLISHKMLEPVPEESAVKAEEPGLDDFEGREA